MTEEKFKEIEKLRTKIAKLTEQIDRLNDSYFNVNSGNCQDCWIEIAYGNGSFRATLTDDVEFVRQLRRSVIEVLTFELTRLQNRFDKL
jgi:hypothetical protein